MEAFSKSAKQRYKKRNKSINLPMRDLHALLESCGLARKTCLAGKQWEAGRGPRDGAVY